MSNSSWIRFFARTALGIMFLMQGTFKVFQIGALEHARRLFVEPYADTFLPAWSLWLTGTTIPFVEFICGALLLLGVRVRVAAIVLGFDLLVVTFGHLLAEPFFQLQTHVMPRLILVLVTLYISEDDRMALDYWLNRRRSSAV